MQDNQNYSILIVDDMPKNIQLVAKFLTQEGYNLFFAQSGDSAIKQIGSRAFDLVLLDVMMPGMDGFSVCEHIKANPATASIPVIFLTAKTDDVAIERGFAVGGVDYLTKPFNPVELVARVKTHIILRQREKELREINNTKDTLLSVISHDLKTPFFNIMGLGEILLSEYDSYDDAMKKELIRNMVDSSRISHNLLENLLSWTRVQTGKIRYSPEEVELSTIINDILALVNQQARNKDVSCSFLAESNLHVFADTHMLQTTIRNLVSNAIKYTPKGGSVYLSVLRKADKAIIEVKDTGIGIPTNRLEKMFMPSNLSTTPGTENEPGTGFGLILTKEFVIKNKGEITVESEEGKGATFRFTVPLHK